MSASRIVEVTCAKCAHKQETTLWESVNATERPELRDLLFNEELNAFCCENCNCVSSIQTALFYHDTERGFCVQYYPPETLDDKKTLQGLTGDGRFNSEDILGFKGEVSGTETKHGYLSRPHIVFDMAEMKRYVYLRELLLQTHAAEARIGAALRELLQREADDSSVIIEEPQSEKFVQFCGGGALGMDVPCDPLTGEEADRASRFFNQLGGGSLMEYEALNPRTKEIRHGATFFHDFGHDASAAARAALAFFTEVYGFPADVELSVEEH